LRVSIPIVETIRKKLPMKILKIQKYFLLVAALAMASKGQAEVIASGIFKKLEASIDAQGGYEIVRDSGVTTLMINDKFVISHGPDLFFVLSPMNDSTANSDNAKTNAVKLTPGLKSVIGKQSYTIADSVDITKFKSLLILCWTYNHLFSTSTLKFPAVSGIKTNSITTRNSFTTNKNQQLSIRFLNQSYGFTGRSQKRKEN